MTTTQAPPALSAPGTLKPLSNDWEQDTRVVSYAAVLDGMTASDLDSLAAILRDRAARQRVQVSYDEALAIVDGTWISPQAERSDFAPIIKVRVAVRRIVERGQFHPEQLDAFLTIAFEVAPHPLIARAAISEGVRDGLERRAAANDN